MKRDSSKNEVHHTRVWFIMYLWGTKQCQIHK